MGTVFNRKLVYVTKHWSYMNKFTTVTLKTSGIVSYKLEEQGGSWKANEEGGAVIKARSNKSIGWPFQSWLENIRREESQSIVDFHTASL